MRLGLTAAQPAKCKGVKMWPSGSTSSQMLTISASRASAFQPDDSLITARPARSQLERAVQAGAGSQDGATDDRDQGLGFAVQVVQCRQVQAATDDHDQGLGFAVQVGAGSH